MTVWPSGLRRWLQAPVRKGVGSNPTAVSARQRSCVAMYPTTKLLPCVCQNVAHATCLQDTLAHILFHANEDRIIPKRMHFEKKIVVPATAYNSIVAVTLDLCMS